ncbi:Integrase core domain protein [compost metagenome]
MNVLKPHLQTTIATLVAAGKGQREIARITGIDRKTIRGYQERFAAAQANSPTVTTGSAPQIPPPRPPAIGGQQLSACALYQEFIQAQLRLHRNATAIYQDLVDQFGFTASYESVKRFVRSSRQHAPKQFDRLEFLPGEEAQVDYGEGAPTRVPGTDRYRKPRLFVMTLRHSRHSFRRVVWKSSQQVWAELHEQAWRYFGGVTQYVVLDNLKEGVLKPDLYEPELNPVYAAMLAHYGVVADPARVRDPDRKGTVENAIQHTQATALKGRRFESIEEQNAFLEQWEANWASKRIHGSTRRQVQAMFEEERPHLRALPAHNFEYFTDRVYTVYDDTCVRVDHSSYAARPAAIGSRVLVRKYAHRLEIRDLKTQALLRSHDLADRPGTVVLPQDERLFNPSRETRRILAQAKAIGPSAECLCQLLFDTEGRVGQRKLWGIVGLVRRYPRRLIDTACEAALREGAPSYRQVKALTERLLEQALADLDAPVQGELPLTQEHPLIRDGDDYADLFTLGARQSAANQGDPL